MLDPIQIGGVPSAQGVWERAYLQTLLQYDAFDTMQNFLANYGTVTNFQKRNVSANWAPTYVTCRIDFTLCIFIQGTENVKQALLHLAGVAFTKVVNDKGILNSQWDGVAADILDELAGDLGGADPPAAIDISGHSYGGGVASLMARRLYTANPRLDLSICTFGAPKASGGTLPPFAARSYVRVRNRNDMVPTLPPVNATVGLRQIAAGGPVTRGALVQWQREGIGLLISDAPEFLTQFSDFQADLQASKAGYSVWVDAHPIEQYQKNLKAWPTVHPPVPVPPPTPAQQQIAEAQPPTPLVFPVPDTSTIFEINLLYYGAGLAIVDAANVFSFESTALSAGAATVRPAANIRVSQRSAPVPTYSGFTKFTLCINNGRNGRLESHVGNIGLDSSLLQPAIVSLCNARANLLGSESLNQNTAVKGRGTPQIEFIKLTDAFFPKLGWVVDLSGRHYFGPTKAAAYPADVLSTALSVRMSGVELNDFPGPTAPAPAATRFLTLQINGQPDDAVKSAAFDPGFTRAPGVYSADLVQYLLYLTVPEAVTWGFVGLSSAQAQIAIQAWNLVTPALPAQPYWSFTLVGAPYNTGDRVRITGVNPNFNGTFFLTKNPDNTYSTNLQPATGRPIPRGGFVRRVGLADRSRSMAFYKYDTWIGFENTAHVPTIKVTKKNTGREFLNLSFRKKSHKLR